MKDDSAAKILMLLVGLTLFAFLVHGYHPGAEDDGVYLPAIKHDLNPALFPHDSDFFALQMQATVFDKLVAGSIRLTHFPLADVVLAWHLLTIFLILCGCWRIGCLCFPEQPARWAAVCTVATLLTLPVAGTALYLVDPNLHPRAVATAAILGAVAAALERRFWVMGMLLAIACAIHPLMASFGISCCVFLLWKPAEPRMLAAAGMTMAMPLGWLFESTSVAWQQAAHTRSYYYLSAWHWYEWIGVFALLLLLWWFSRLGQKVKLPVLTRLPLLENSDDFVFDNQMLAQCVHFGFRLGEVSCPTKYFEAASSINFRRSVKYGLGVVGTTLQFVLERAGLGRSAIFSEKGRTLGSAADLYYKNGTPAAAPQDSPEPVEMRGGSLSSTILRGKRQ